MKKIDEGKRVFDVEIEALSKMRDALDETFMSIVDSMINCKGKVIVTGIGKPGHIAKKIAATMASLGTPSFYLHPAEAMHGDLGMISKDDVVIAISYSGESDEIVNILPNIKLIGAKLVGLTGNANSTLALASDIVQVFPKFEEACVLGLAPSSSTTVELCYGDALAIVASEINHFKDIDYAKFHPAGSLGKKLILKVMDLMAKDNDNAVIPEGASIKTAILELSKKGLGIVSIVNSDNHLVGIITDGDLRRQLEKNVDIYALSVEDVMTRIPSTIQKRRLAMDALKIMKERNISSMPVLDEDKVCGTIRLQDIIRVGIVG